MSFIFLSGPEAFFRSGVRILLLSLALAVLTGCAGRLNKAVDQFYAGHPETSLTALEKGDWFGERNQLLFLMERGLVLHQLGRFRESTDVLLRAAELIKEFELISVSEQFGSLVTTEWLQRYKGEYSERLWVHSYLMMNFLLLGEYESAYVEARQALELVDRYPEALKNDHFSRALIALCFNIVAEDNDAYLVYRRLAEDLPSPTPVAVDLVEISSRLGQLDEVEHFQKHLPAEAPTGQGELVLFLANGRVPRKLPGNVVLPPSIRFSFPYYDALATPRLTIGLSPRFPSLPPISSDLAAVAEDALAARKMAIIVKETARVAAKEAISQKVGEQHGQAAEAVVRISLFLLEEPDTRSWQTLPGRLTLVRIPLPAGQHILSVQLRGTSLLSTQQMTLPEFRLRPGQRVFHSLRL